MRLANAYSQTRGQAWTLRGLLGCLSLLITRLKTPAMRVTGSPNGRFLGYVHVQVASRMYVLPVESCSLTLDDGSTLEPGFFEESAGRFAIRVSSEASDSVVQETIEHASAEAARLISRKFLN